MNPILILKILFQLSASLEVFNLHSAFKLQVSQVSVAVLLHMLGNTTVLTAPNSFVVFYAEFQYASKT